MEQSLQSCNQRRSCWGQLACVGHKVSLPDLTFLFFATPPLRLTAFVCSRLTLTGWLGTVQSWLEKEALTWVLRCQGDILYSDVVGHGLTFVCRTTALYQ